MSSIDAYHVRQEVLRDSSPQSVEERLQSFKTPEKVRRDIEQMRWLVSGTMVEHHVHTAESVAQTDQTFVPSLQYIEDVSEDNEYPDFQLRGGWIDREQARILLATYDQVFPAT